MNQLKLVDEREVLGKEFRIYGDSENPLFLAKDVASWIDYDPTSTNKLMAMVEENEKLNGTIFLAGQNREVTLLTEDGVYEVLMQSRKPIARQFKKQVKEILRTIRKHGVYATSERLEEMLNDPDAMITVLTTLKEEREKAKLLQTKIEEDKPKVLFADAVSASKTTILVGELAKLLKQNGVELGQNRLFEWLRENGYLIKRKGTDYNMPTQRSMEMGLFTVKETAVTHSDGHVAISKTAKVVGKGQQYFINKFLNHNLN